MSTDAEEIQLRRDTSANWSTANPVLAAGEIGVDLTTGHLKVGDGVTAWNALSYLSSGGGGGGPITSAQITDATTVGRDVLTATDATSARTAIGAGTSSLGIGTTSTTAKAGNYAPASTDIVDATAVGKALLTAVDAPTARTTIGAGTSNFSGIYTDLSGKPTLAAVATSGAYTDLSGLPALGTNPQGGQTDVASRFTVDENRITNLENAGAGTSGAEVGSAILTTTFAIGSSTTWNDTGLSVAVPAQTRGYNVQTLGQFVLVTNSSFVATKTINAMVRIVDSGVTVLLDNGEFPYNLVASGAQTLVYRFALLGRVAPGQAATTWKVQARVGQALDANITSFGIYATTTPVAPASGVAATPALLQAITF